MKIWKEFRETFEDYKPDASAVSWEVLEQQLSYAEQFARNPYQPVKKGKYILKNPLHFLHMSNLARVSVITGAAALLISGIALFTTPFTKSDPNITQQNTIQTEISNSEIRNPEKFSQYSAPGIENQSYTDSLSRESHALQSLDTRNSPIITHQNHNALVQKNQPSSIRDTKKEQPSTNYTQPKQNTQVPFTPSPIYQPQQQPLYVYNSVPSQQNGVVNQNPKTTASPVNTTSSQQLTEKKELQQKDIKINPDDRIDSENSRLNDPLNEGKSEVPQRPELEIPNVITPNGDGYNDEFKIKNLDKYDLKNLTITDRNGRIVFESLDYQNNWDARNLSDGAYYYILKISYKGENFVKTGVLTVMRHR